MKLSQLSFDCLIEVFLLSFISENKVKILNRVKIRPNFTS